MNRIELIASLCRDAECVCDVGCDHAYVLVKALKEYNAQRGIAADVAAGPLSCASDSIKSAHLEERIDVVLSDGFRFVDLSFTHAVIAGMGGFLIRTILDAGYEKIRGKKLILEPNTDQIVVREWLTTHGFSITDEYSIYDMDKYYEIIVAEEGNSSYVKEEIKYGPVLLKKKEEAFLSYYRKKAEMLENVIASVKSEEVKSEKIRELEEIKNLVLCPGA